MRTREIDHRTGSTVADPVRQQALWDLAIAREAPISDAPEYAPQAAGCVLLLAGPKEPQEPRRPKVKG